MGDVPGFGNPVGQAAATVLRPLWPPHRPFWR